jgi:hypothetical protein
MTTGSKHLPVLAGWQVPALRALDLATVYCDETTTLVSLAHRCVIADFDGEEPQQGIPHLHVTGAVERAAAADAGLEYDGWPGWEAVFAYVAGHRGLLKTDHYSQDTKASIGQAGPNDPRLAGLVRELEAMAEADGDVQLAVDDLIYDHVGTSKSASGINNQGISGQAEALAERLGVEETLAMLQEVAGQFEGDQKKARKHQ